MPNIRENIQKNIVRYRKEAKLTQAELAKKIGVSSPTLSSWEQGKSIPDIDKLYEISVVLGVDLVTISGFALGEGQPDALTIDEQQLVSDYRELNAQGQEYIRQTMHMAKGTYKKMLDVPDLERQA